MINETQDLLAFFKAMADANRLKIVGLLAKQAYTVEQLAAMLGLSESTVSHHLAKLSAAGLVSASAQSYYNYYRLNAERVQNTARRLIAVETLAEAAADVDAGAFDRKIVNDFLLPNGQLKTIPAQRKKLETVLRYLVQNFEPDRRYSEKEVNQILKRFHADTASLRREMIGFGLLAREPSGEAYWRTETAD